MQSTAFSRAGNATHRVIEIGLHGIEVEDIQARVSTLERKRDRGEIPECGDSDGDKEDCEEDRAA